MKTHKITPYKGGRDAVLSPIRVTKDEKQMIGDKKEKYNLSYSDLVVNAVRQYKPCRN